MAAGYRGCRLGLAWVSARRATHRSHHGYGWLYPALCCCAQDMQSIETSQTAKQVIHNRVQSCTIENQSWKRCNINVSVAVNVHGSSNLA